MSKATLLALLLCAGCDYPLRPLTNAHARCAITKIVMSEANPYGVWCVVCGGGPDALSCDWRGEWAKR